MSISTGICRLMTDGVLYEDENGRAIEKVPCVNAAVTINFAGPWAAAQPAALYLTKDGDKASCRFPAVGAAFNAGAVATSATALPLRYRPATAQVLPMLVIDAAGVATSVGQIAIATTGIMVVSLINAGVYTAGAGCGWPAQTVTWLLA